MGAWEVGSFENDNALDWVWGLDDAQDTGILEETFSSILESGDYLEAPYCCEALAAAEVVAALHGTPLPKVPPEVTAFVARVATPPSQELLQMAVQAVERIKEKSELRDIWDESASATKWLDDVTNLQKRLT